MLAERDVVGRQALPESFTVCAKKSVVRARHLVFRQAML